MQIWVRTPNSVFIFDSLQTGHMVLHKKPNGLHGTLQASFTWHTTTLEAHNLAGTAYKVISTSGH